MKNKVWDKLNRLALGLWAGGLVAIDLVDAPARFATKGLDRNQITKVGRNVFAAFNRYEVGLSAVALPTALATSRRRAVLTGLLTAASLAQLTYLQPQMAKLGAQLDFVNRDASDPRYSQHRRLHSAYMVLDLVKLGLAVPALLLDEH